MSFKHILVAVDLTNESRTLVKHATELAKALNAKVSLIHVDLRHGDVYPGEMVNPSAAASRSNRTDQESQNVLQVLKENSDYPITHTLVSTGSIDDEIEDAIRIYDVDLLVCGHHQNFWHTVVSSAKQLMGSIPIEMLIIPINES